MPFRWRRQREADLDDEIRAHLQAAIRDRMDTGESARDAESAARREFGSVSLVKEVTRSLWGPRWLADIFHDVAYAYRTLARKPGFLLAAVAMMTLAIGSNVATFSVADRVLFHPLDLPRASRLVALGNQSNRGGTISIGQFFTYEQYEAATRVSAFEETAALASRALAISYEEESRRAAVLFVTPNYFQTLGLAPVRGRSFEPADDLASAAPVALLSEPTWRTRFGADPRIVGRTIRINGVMVTVVGVGPAEFFGTALGTGTPELFLPFRTIAQFLLGNYFGPAGSIVNGTSVISWLTIIARLAPESTAERATAELSARLAEARFVATPIVFPLEQAAVPWSSRPDVVRFSLLLACAAALLFAAGCANLSALMLARGEERRLELATRLAIGASRGRIVRQLLVETAAVIVPSGIASVFAAFGMSAAIGRFELPGRVAVSQLRSPLDTRVVLFASAVTFLATLVCGVGPALRATRGDLGPELKRRAGGVAGSAFGPARFLLATQVGVSIVLLFGAGLFIRSLESALSADLGFDSDQLTAARISVGSKSSNQDAFADALLANVRAVPGVQSAALGLPPLAGSNGSTPAVQIDGRPRQLAIDDQLQVECGGSDYFTTIGQPMLAGRAFAPADDVGGAAAAVVVNESAARRFWPNQSAIGKRLSAGPWAHDAEVVGVAGDVKYRSLREDGVMAAYFPAHGSACGAPGIVVRASKGVNIEHELERAAGAVSSDLTLYDVRSIAERVDLLLMPQRLARALLGALGGMAALLALIGVYSLVSCIVVRSRRDVAIRVALGASPRAIASLLARAVTLPVAAGLAGGSLGALWAGKFADRFMYGIGSGDPVTLASVGALLAILAVAAAAAPARRALRVDPVRALRAE
jgi:predicted permease